MPQSTFDTVGSHTFDVPSGVPELIIEAWGAPGASGSSSGNTGGGGEGGYVNAVVLPEDIGGSQLQIEVGGAGGNTSGGYNGGADGAGNSADNYEAGGGGGASDVRDGTGLSDRIVVAGGGGGGAAVRHSNTDAGHGGSGGADTGEDGSGTSYDGGGGTQSSGGSGGSSGGSSGSLGSGGSGASGSDNDYHGGGGGGGYYGGGGGGAEGFEAGGGAGGGSNFTASVVTVETNQRGGSTSAQVVITWVEPPSNLSVDAERESEVDLSWDAPPSADEYQVYRHDSTDPYANGAVVATVTDDGSQSYTYTDTGLTNGKQYHYQVTSIENGDESGPTGEVIGRMQLPSPVIDTVNPYGDRVEFDYSLPDDNPDGHVDVLRSTDGSMGSEIGTITDLSQTSFADTDVATGETYHYTFRRDTGDVSTFSTQIEETATFRPITGLQIDSVSKQSIELSWEDGDSAWTGETEVWRDRSDYEYADPKGTQVATLADDVLSYTDTELPPEREFTYTIVAAADGEGDAATDPETAETLSIGARQTRLPSSGWLVEVDHPGGRTLRPTLLDGTNRSPSIRDLYRATAHVPMDDRWQDDSWEQVPARAWADGDRLPVEQLDSVGRTESSSDASSTLELVGGTGLRTRVERDVDTQPVHELIEELVEEHTDLVVNVDPPATTSTTEVMLDLLEVADWESALAETDLSTIPITVDQDGGLASQQSCWVFEAEDDFTSESGTAFTNGASYSGTGGDDGFGGAQRLDNAGDHLEFEVDVPFEIPQDAVGLQSREDASTDNHGEIVWQIDGNTTYVMSEGQVSGANINWFDRSEGGPQDADYTGGPLRPEDNPHTIRVEQTTGGAGGDYNVDAVALYDNRYDYDFDNDVTTAADGSNYLDGPQPFPEPSITLDRIRSVLSIAGVEIDVEADDVSGGQALEVRNATGDGWLTASNSETFDATFDQLGALLDVRLTFGRHGSQEETPAQGIEGQRIESLTATADLDTTPLVIQRSPDDTILALAKQLAKNSNSVFGIGIDDGQLSFEWTQIGQRDGGEVVDVELLDESTNYDHPERVVVYGGHQDVREERISASVGEPVDLANDHVDANSEWVRSLTGDDFEEGDDYTIDWSAGTITVLEEGEISDGTNLHVDYRYQPRAAQELDGVGDDPREIVEQIPELETERGCGLAAFRILQEVGEPLQSATVQIPDDAGVSVVESVSAEGLTADSYELRSIDGQAAGSRLELGSRQQAPDVVDDLRSQLRSLSGQV